MMFDDMPVERQNTMFDDMPVERRNTMFNHITKIIKTIFRTDAEVHMLVDGL